MADTTLNIVLKGDTTGSSGSGGSHIPTATAISMGSSTGLGVGGLAAGVFLGTMATTVVSVAISSIKNLYDSVVNKVRESIDQLKNYSGTVAQAVAQAEIRRVNVQLERDSRVGADIATFVEQSSRQETAIEGIWTTLIRAFAPVINDIQALMTAFLEAFKDFATPLGETIREMYREYRKGIANLTGWVIDSGWLPELLKDVLKKFQTWLNLELNPDDIVDQNIQLLNFLRAVSGVNPGARGGRDLGGTAPVFF